MKSSNKKVAIFVNMHASRAKRNRKKVESQIKRMSELCNVQLFIAENADDIEKQMDAAVSFKPDVLMLGGGDGTLVSGISYAQNNGYKGIFGFLPLGTSNYLARNLEVHMNVEAALNAAINGKKKNINLGKANDKLFALMATIGITTSVAQNVTVGDKRRYRQVAYLVGAFRALKSHSKFEFSVHDVDNSKFHSGTAHQILVLNANLRQQLPITPSASIHERELKVVLYRSPSTLSFLLNLVLYILSAGRIKRGTQEMSGEHFRIQTERHLPVSLDGEVFKDTDVDISVYDKKVTIIS